jgi:hypothetical protein
MIQCVICALRDLVSSTHPKPAFSIIFTVPT